MSVGGSGSADDFTIAPDLGGSRKLKKTAATAATQKRNRETEGIKESPVDVPAAINAAQEKRDANYIAGRQAQHIAHFQGPEAAKEFLARHRKVSAAAIESARQFALPKKPEKMSRDERHMLMAEAESIKATMGKQAYGEFVAERIHGISRQSIIESRQFAVPEQDANQNLRNNLFGGFSAFGLVQSSLAAFGEGLRLANQSLANFVETAVLAGSPNVNLMTDPAKALLATAPGIGAGIGALLTANPIVGGAIGFLGGTALSATVGAMLQTAQSFDSAVANLTTSLVGFSPAISVQSALQDARRIQRQFERAQSLESPLMAVSEARFRLEEALAGFGDRLVLRFAPLIERVLDALTTILELIEVFV
jgi:hypothetical protein